MDDSDRNSDDRWGEDHRGFVREMHNQLGKTYGTGGGVVVAALVSLVLVAVLTGWWTQWMLWIPGLTVVLAVVYGVRHRIYARRDRMRLRVEEYCRANDIETDQLLEYFDIDEMYPFFGAIFEESPRRRIDGDKADRSGA